VALPATQCRIQVSALVGGNNVSRTLQAVMDRADNFVGGPLIASFNDPAGNVAPVSWTGGAYDYAGGYLAGAPVQPNCTRSGYALKAVSGAGTATATSQGSASVAFSVARPSTILASFDYRIIQVGSGSLGCTTNAGPELPALRRIPRSMRLRLRVPETARFAWRSGTPPEQTGVRRATRP